MKHKTVLQIASIFILISIVFGAFGAHALKEKLNQEQLNSFEVGIRYMLYHGLAFMALIWIEKEWNLNFKLVFRLLLMGVLFFSGSIFLLTFQHLVHIDLKFLWPITPMGGLMLIIGWLLVFLKVSKIKKSEG